MTNGLSDKKVTWLTYLVYILLAFLTLITGWQQLMVATIQADQKAIEKTLPDKYVSKERYLTDKHFTETALGVIQSDVKLILGKIK